MAERSVLNTLNPSVFNSMNSSILSNTGRSSASKNHLGSSIHNLSRTKSPTKLSSKSGMHAHKMVPVQKYEELVAHYNELVKVNKLLKSQKDQFYNGYHQLKFISEKEKTQLCQAFEELKTNYMQLQAKCQSMAQQNSNKGGYSSIQKLASGVAELPQQNIYTIKDQYNLLYTENKNTKAKLQVLQRQLSHTMSLLEKCLQEKLDLQNSIKKIQKEKDSNLQNTQFKTAQQLRRQIHQQQEKWKSQRQNPNKTANSETTKVSLLIEQNMNLIAWRTNLENYYKREMQKMQQQIEKMQQTIGSQQVQLVQKESYAFKLKEHLEAVISQNQRIQQRSSIIQNEMGKMKAESIQVKEKASQQYKQRIAQILDNAFNLRT